VPDPENWKKPKGQIHVEFNKKRQEPISGWKGNVDMCNVLLDFSCKLSG